MPFVSRLLLGLSVLCCPAVLLAQTIPVTVSVAPQGYFVKAIGGDRVSVNVMVEPGQSPHTFSPSPRQLMALADGRVYVKVGHPDYTFEQRFLRQVDALDRDVHVVDMSAGVEYRTQEGHGDKDGHSHEDQNHGETDPHIWVSPRIVRQAADRIAAALIKADPEGRPEYEAGLQRFLREVDALDAELRAQMDGLSRRTFLVNHPAWGYFADEYGLKQHAIESEGKDVSPVHLAALIEDARANGIRVVLVQPGFSSRGAEVVARELGAQVVTADPNAADWATSLRDLSHVLTEADR